MDEQKKSDERENHFEEKVGEKSRRKIKARRKSQKGVWFGLGMFGLVGWSVTIPTLLMLALGIWIDSISNSQYSWTLMLLVVGIAIGCLNAWYWIKQEGKEIE